MSDKNNDNEGSGDGNGGPGGSDGHGSGKKTKIFVNTREKVVSGDEVNFNQIVGLAFEMPPTGANIEITIAYRKGPHENPSGTLHPGETVEIKEGMIFDVTATDKS